MRPIDDLPPREARNLDAARAEVRVSCSISLEGVAVAVVGEAIDFDRQSNLGPEEIDLESVQAHVAAGHGEAGGTDQGQQPPLGLRPREVRATLCSEDPVQGAPAMMPRSPTSQLIEFARAKQPQGPGLAEDLFQHLRLGIYREVEQGARGGSEGDGCDCRKVQRV